MVSIVMTPFYNFILIVITLYISHVENIELSEYLVPKEVSEFSETYVHKGKEYILYSKEVTWEEANFICKYEKGILGILDSSELTEFAMEILLTTEFSLEYAWIGASRDESSSNFRWLTGAPLPHGPENMRDLEKDQDQLYLMWWNKTTSQDEEDDNCVVISRIRHDKPTFINLPCLMTRPFMCEKSILKSSDVRELGAVQYGNYKYHIFKGRYTWQEAAGYCAYNNMVLAKVETEACMEKIGKKLLRIRPSLENAWLGGKGSNHVWKWSHSGDVINNHIGSNKSVWFPFGSKKMKKEGCVLIDRHLCNNTVFIQSRCDKKKDFICMEERLSESAKLLDIVRNIYLTYIIQDHMVWEDAFKSCKSKKGSLLSILDKETVLQTLQYMAENNIEALQHIWISGTLKTTIKETNYIWFDPEKNMTIPGPKNVSKNIVPWCDEDIDPDYDCLNLDRENYLQGLIYGMPCDTLQSSICIVDDEKDRNVAISTTTETTESRNETEVKNITEGPTTVMPITSSTDSQNVNLTLTTESLLDNTESTSTKSPLNTTEPVSTESSKNDTESTSTKSPLNTTVPVSTESPLNSTVPVSTESPLNTIVPVSTESPLNTIVPVSTESPLNSTESESTMSPLNTTEPVLTESSKNDIEPTSTKSPLNTTVTVSTESIKNNTEPTSTESLLNDTNPTSTDLPSISTVSPPKITESESTESLKNNTEPISTESLLNATNPTSTDLPLISTVSPQKTTPIFAMSPLNITLMSSTESSINNTQPIASSKISNIESFTQSTYLTVDQQTNKTTPVTESSINKINSTTTQKTDQTTLKESPPLNITTESNQTFQTESSTIDTNSTDLITESLDIDIDDLITTTPSSDNTQEITAENITVFYEMTTVSNVATSSTQGMRPPGGLIEWISEHIPIVSKNKKYIEGSKL